MYSSVSWANANFLDDVIRIKLVAHHMDMAIRFGPLLSKLEEDVPLIGFMVMLQFNPLGNRVIGDREMRYRWKCKGQSLVKGLANNR
mmetsp:Transcript_16700/g.30373  ORF Transcript_16700/g.30373 Transcript_16700/m.30373 type:complete len:87 (-) Transcript_16700:39-299(-)